MSGFSDQILGGAGTLIRKFIQSKNYAAGVAGWQVASNGNAEFNSGTFRGGVVSGPVNNQIAMVSDGSIPAELQAFYGNRVTSVILYYAGTNARYFYNALLSASGTELDTACGWGIDGSIYEQTLNKFTVGGVPTIEQLFTGRSAIVQNHYGLAGRTPDPNDLIQIENSTTLNVLGDMRLDNVSAGRGFIGGGKSAAGVTATTAGGVVVGAQTTDSLGNPQAVTLENNRVYRVELYGKVGNSVGGAAGLFFHIRKGNTVGAPIIVDCGEIGQANVPSMITALICNHSGVNVNTALCVTIQCTTGTSIDWQPAGNRGFSIEDVGSFNDWNGILPIESV